MIKGRDRVQIDSVKYGNHYKGTDMLTHDLLDYIACLQRQVDRLSERVHELEMQKEDDSK